jgi:hypothetical protein
MTRQTDLIFCLSQKRKLPEYPTGSNKIIYWKIEDPDGRDYNYHIRMRNQIDQMVKCLLSELG